MASQLNVKGLFTYQAELTAPDGSLEVADNIDLDQDNAATPRRGFDVYGTAFATPAKQLLSYKKKLLKHTGETLQFDSNDKGSWTSFNGSLKEVEAGLRIKAQELRSNLYITSATGIKKLSLSDIATININSLENSGVPRALDINPTLDTTVSGILPIETAVSYAAVWGILDGNKAELLGYPSAIAKLEFRGIPQLVKDFNSVCTALATNTGVAVYNSFKIDVNSSAIELYLKIVELANEISIRFDSNSVTPTAVPQYIWATIALANKMNLGSIEVINDVLYLRFTKALSSILSDGAVIGQKVATYGMPSEVLEYEGIATITSVGRLPLTYTARKATGGNSFANLTTYTVASNVCTLTFEVDTPGTSGSPSNINNRVVAGQKITIEGATVAALNGSFTVTGTPTATTLQFTLNTANVTAAGVTGVVYVSEQSSTTARTIAIQAQGLDNIVGIAGTAVVGSAGSYLALPRAEKPQEDGTYTYANVLQIADYLDLIIAKLYSESPTVLPSTTGIELVRRSAAPSFSLDIPPTITSTKYFYRVYRSRLQTPGDTSNLDDVATSNELQLAYEGTISQAEINAGLTNPIVDIATDDFVAQNEPLYTNLATGETAGRGIADANSIPPVARDVTEFRGRLFFGNTRNQFGLTASLLSTDNLDSTRNFVLAYKDGSGTAQSIDLMFIEPWARSEISFVGADPVDTGPASTIVIKGSSSVSYTFGFIQGPIPFGSTFATDETHVLVDCTFLTTDQQITQAFYEAIQRSASEYFDVIYDGVSTSLTIINKKTDATAYSSHVTTGVAWTVAPSYTLTRNSLSYDPVASPQDGIVLLYKDENYSIGQKIDLTAKAIVNAINKYDANTLFVSYYNSTENTQPGSIQIEEREIGLVNEFYVYISGVIGEEQVMNPRVEAIRNISNVASVASGTQFLVTVTYTGASLTTKFSIGDFIFLDTPSYSGPVQITQIGPSTFQFLSSVSITDTMGDVGFFNKATNQVRENGLSWSKFQQPDAVPLANFILIGPQDKKIKRIVGLRDSLMVFKEEGIYRVFQSGENFDYQLIESSAIIEADDSIAILNNQIFVLTTQGVCIITDTGATIKSHQIKDKIDRIIAFDSTKIFGISSEIDNAYLLFCPTKDSDDTATQVLRYNTQTEYWSRYLLKSRCGISLARLLYLGSGVDSYVEQQRRNLDRRDYADRELFDTLSTYDYFPNVLEVFSNAVAQYKPGDVVSQKQFVTITRFNNLINKMNYDSGLVFFKGQTIPDSFRALIAENMNDRINSLIVYLQTFNSQNAFGAVTLTPLAGNATFAEAGDKYNEIVQALNELDSSSTARDYKFITTVVEFESPIASINRQNNKFKILTVQPFCQGEISIYQAIPTNIIFNPSTFGAPEVLKHVREGTLILEEVYITNGFIKYASDLKPVFEKIEIRDAVNGNGAWGLQNWGSQFWGGDGPETPVRTIIPKDKQRCRFLRVGFEHSVAREHYSLYGFSLEVNQASSSSRGYIKR